MPQKGLSGSTLKLIAIITMLIDHIGAAVIARLLIAGQGSEMLYKIYYAMRAVGRVAFPIFCFLLVEGFFYTGSRKKYALRLFGFALLSEIPFDLAFSGKTLEFGYQNVFFTLLIGLLTIMLFDAVVKKQEWHPVLRSALLVIITFGGMGAAYLLHTDYDAKGVLAILVFYMTRQMPLDTLHRNIDHECDRASNQKRHHNPQHKIHRSDHHVKMLHPAIEQNPKCNDLHHPFPRLL